MLIRATNNGGAVYVVDAKGEIVAQFDVQPAGTSPDEGPGDRSEATSAAGDDEGPAKSDANAPGEPAPK
jgi:hypothetical protein